MTLLPHSEVAGAAPGHVSIKLLREANVDCLFTVSYFFKYP